VAAITIVGGNRSSFLERLYHIMLYWIQFVLYNIHNIAKT